MQVESACSPGVLCDPEPLAVNGVPAIELLNVTRRFGDVTAVDDISLSLRRGEFFSLLGPSGCGKTTLLRLVAGLDLPDAGTVRIGGCEATDLPAHRRPVNTVFQSYALFPHLNVQDNIAFGLRMKRLAEAQIADRVQRVMHMVQIPELARRRPAQLSGGQKQRVALARAIVNEPDVLLLDEPLGALDLKLRKQLQVELHTLQQRLGITFVYVTHDQEEALVMSDRIAVLNAGRVEQVGPAVEIYERPRTRFVAQFIGSCNLVSGTVRACSNGSIWAETPLGSLRVERGRHGAALTEGVPCTLAIRPEKLRVKTGPEAREPNAARATVQDFIYTGSETQYLLETPAGPFKAWVLNTKAGYQRFRIGQEMSIQLPPEALVVLDD